VKKKEIKKNKRKKKERKKAHYMRWHAVLVFASADAPAAPIPHFQLVNLLVRPS
jgi:hypothetical protein